MNNLIYIGKVVRVHDNPEKNYRHATIEPFIQSSENQSYWEGSIEDPIQDFPGRGCVNWHDAPKGLEEGDFRQFDVKEHPYYSGEPERDAFQVNNPKYPTEIIDLREIGTERDIRILLTSTGIFLNDRPLVERCVLWIEDEKWLGPASLIQRTGTSSWIIDPETRHLHSFRCYNIPSQSIQKVELEGTRYLLVPNQNLGKHIGFVNWLPDNVLAERVLKRLKKLNPETAKSLEVSKKVFKAYIDTIEQAGLVESQPNEELAFYDRIKEVFDMIAQKEELLEEAASVCYSIDLVKERVQEKAEKEYQSKLTEHQVLLDEDLSSLKDELKMVDLTLSNRKSERSSIEEQINDLENELKNRTAEFETELEKKLLDLSERPQRLFAEMAFTKALIPKTAVTNIATPKSGQRKIQRSELSCPTITKLSDFLKEYSMRLLEGQCSPIVGMSLQSSHLAGLVPVIVGSDSYSIISSYADLLTGGVVNWIPVGGSIFEPSDLLARFDPMSCRLIPHPGGLLDLLLDDSDAMHLVVLDGFNRAAVDGYLIPLLKCAQDINKGRKPRAIPLAPSGFIAEDDSYASVSKVAWNRNVLLILTSCSGASTLPIPNELWSYCTVVDSSVASPMGISSNNPSNHEKQVSASIWKGWSKDAKIKRQEPLIDQSGELDPLPQVVHNNLESIYGALTTLGLSHEKALELAIKTYFIPYLVANEEKTDEWVRHLNLEPTKLASNVCETVRKLGR